MKRMILIITLMLMSSLDASAAYLSPLIDLMSNAYNSTVNKEQYSLCKSMQDLLKLSKNDIKQCINDRTYRQKLNIKWYTMHALKREQEFLTSKEKLYPIGFDLHKAIYVDDTNSLRGRYQDKQWDTSDIGAIYAIKGTLTYFPIDPALKNNPLNISRVSMFENYGVLAEVSKLTKEQEGLLNLYCKSGKLCVGILYFVVDNDLKINEIKKRLYKDEKYSEIIDLQFIGAELKPIKAEDILDTWAWFIKHDQDI